jgi:hypothetical protein
MRKALVRLEQLQAEKTSLEDELAGVRRACANFERGAAEAGRRISELVAANTPLLGVVTAARLFVEAQTRGREGEVSEAARQHPAGTCQARSRPAFCRACAADFLGGGVDWFDGGPRRELPFIWLHGKRMWLIDDLRAFLRAHKEVAPCPVSATSSTRGTIRRSGGSTSATEEESSAARRESLSPAVEMLRRRQQKSLLRATRRKEGQSQTPSGS